MTGNGYAQLPRAVLQTEWSRNANTLAVYARLLARASYQRETVGGVYLERGQTIITLRKFARECGISIKILRSSLDNLEAAGAISTTVVDARGAHLHTVVTVCNYGDYKDGGTIEGTESQERAHLWAHPVEASTGYRPNGYRGHAATEGTPLGTFLKKSNKNYKREI